MSLIANVLSILMHPPTLKNMSCVAQLNYRTDFHKAWMKDRSRPRIDHVTF